MTEVKTDNRFKIPVSEFRLLREFMPEWNEPVYDSEFVELDWNTLMPVVEKIREYRIAYPEQANEVCNLKIVVLQSVLYKRVVDFIKFLNEEKK